MASDPAISPDGSYLAFVREKGSPSHIYLKNLANGDEISLPFAFRNYYTPTWSANGEIIAFAASGSIDNSDSSEIEEEGKDQVDRNIYIFDQVEQIVDPISVGPEDDAEPAFSPTEPNTLVFSRAEGNHRQLWMAATNENGKTEHRQLTRFGGQNPTWLPNGKGVVYENNGQLWMINVSDYEEKPLLIRGKPVFGLEPNTR
jgi:Tol biopolymer transport system component